VRAVARAGYKRLVQLVENRLQSLVKTGAPVLASAIVSTMVGAVTLANIASDPATASSIVSNAQAFIRSHLSSCMNVPRTKKPVLRRSHSRS
jgi:TetR/AcrR family transcriptional regulator, transcriptional repressor for nem operon